LLLRALQQQQVRRCRHCPNLCRLLLLSLCRQHLSLRQQQQTHMVLLMLLLHQPSRQQQQQQQGL
jgi:hypothetical protein